MKIKFLVLICAVFVIRGGIPLFAQGQLPTPDTVFAGVPANPCPTGHFAQNAATGDVYACDSATTNWYLITSGTGVLTGSGTAPQVTYWTAPTVVSGSNALLMTNGSTADSLNLASTTDATHGVISIKGFPLLHSFPSGFDNIFLGADDGSSFGVAGNFTLTGNNNVGIGASALSVLTSGGNNTAIGGYSLISLTTGQDNVAAGVGAGNTAITGSQNTLIGRSSNVSDSAATNQTAIGAGAVAPADNTAQIGNTSVTAALFGAAAGATLGTAPLPVANTFIGNAANQTFTWNVAGLTGNRTAFVPDTGSTLVVPDTGAANNFLTAVSATGAISKAQPSFSNISGTATAGQMPTGVSPVLSGTTGSIGGGLLTIGTCASGTAAVTGARTTMAVAATPATYPGDGNYWLSYVSANDVVTVKVYAVATLTPSASTYIVRVIQ